ncbi:tautomerase family protein [Methylobacterium sp. ID0610]|uniref:tautomerase family protein n=1 Tax=Methylobacterium carpenticola TaxID=3344827 RepID=UPI0036B19841
MPLTRISLRAGRDAAWQRALVMGIDAALRETFAVPEDDRFMLIHEHAAETFVYGATYLDIPRSDDLVIIQITCNDTRSTAQKRALFRAIADRLARDPGLRPEDVLISLIEVKPENWSLGRGAMQYGPT